MKKVRIVPSEEHPSRIDPSGTITYEQSPVWVEGVVSTAEQYVTFVGPKVHWFTFAAWQTVGTTKVQTSKLLVFRNFEDERFVLTEIAARSTLRVRVFLNVEAGRAVLLEGYFLEQTSADLAAAAARVIPPERVFADEFGELLWQSVERFEGRANWLGSPIGISFSYGEKARSIQRHLDAARQLWADQAGWDERMKVMAANKLLKLKNKHWLEPGDPSLTLQQFVDLMEMREIVIAQTGKFEAWFGAESLFGGHAIVVFGNVKNGVQGAGMG